MLMMGNRAEKELQEGPERVVGAGLVLHSELA